MSGWLEPVHAVYAFISAYWPYARDFFNSVFFTAIAGSFAGAFAGARAAQLIAEKTRNKEEMLREIRNTNSATMLAFGICNSLISAKKQHIKSLKDGFDQHKISAKEALIKQKLEPTVFEFQADFRTLPLLNVPTAIVIAQGVGQEARIGRPWRAFEIA
jgi:hypothetical protein